MKAPGEMVDVNDCEKLRLAGNEKYKSGLFEDAETLYTQALGLCSEGDKHSAALLGNRSLVRLKQGKFQEALEDAQLSIGRDVDYVKGHDRKAAAFIAMNKKWQARRTYAFALEHFKNVKNHQASVFMSRKYKELCGLCAKDDFISVVESMEHFDEIFKHMKLERMRLATMATFWNASSNQDRLAIFAAFIQVLTGESKPIQVESLSALPMDNYKDVVIPQTWTDFFNSLDQGDKVKMFYQIYGHCTDIERNMIIRDLKEFFPNVSP
uniref:Uncharacterized protein n=1 Tax=Mucochytrium quahogii TaxID=96639 RepID=A0A7S2SEB7_9STRA|mmetsp:Transcript_19836/g.32597  ORF Transcript_19836/g.32597 Transcript_19836/m.32597 type:complete len:267 (-) Transcript_19836:122-922(-)|eukprot:CAMPEP_0203759684 /NCGR_PEP_ID=MMETSP0098-20131031/12802_1 /ASSEMBLY_ACC=CAM_ASM_000208 /TAXON_ID=96639 /ORGANISM=" , Strain NY0313808BC1" /LENGTH=266 /DNA_ID=CAMNT_0050652815 /DNA_START=263 /DNA_END=1063 /DNA_ORIENTATION=-